jgi:hypothetical protein
MFQKWQVRVTESRSVTARPGGPGRNLLCEEITGRFQDNRNVLSWDFGGGHTIVKSIGIAHFKLVSFISTFKKLN